jgi:hypothetical protein
MNLVLRFRSTVAILSAALASEFDQLLARINLWSAREHQADGTHGAISVTGLTFDGETQTTVGAVGAASPLPAAPSGYAVVTIDGTEVVVPFYAKS